MSEQQRKLRATLVFVAFLILCWALSGGLLWWSYHITFLIREGFYQVNRALSLVAQMGLIVTALTAVGWLLVSRRRAGGPPWRLMWRAAWRTWVVLLIYGGAVLTRMELGNYNVPLPDSAFLPVLGHVNSYFFSEAGWLVFFLYIVPVMGCISGVLYYLQVLALKGSDSLANATAG